MSKPILIFILISALWLRTHRVGDMLGFYYDQGRDALVIWNLIHSHKFFLIGPTTGIEGIFLGPFYYYLLTPAYWIGQGNPVAAALLLAIINVLGIYWIYRIGRDFFSTSVGLVAAGLSCFSVSLVTAHRWLANPTPLPLFAALAVWSVLKIINGENKWWWLLGLSMGLGLQLEAASAVFFIPAAMVIFLINRRTINWKVKPVLLFFLAFGLTLAPQIIFNLRHQNILVDSFMKFLVGEKSFQPTLTSFLFDRLTFFWNTFIRILFPNSAWGKVFVTLTLTLGIIGLKKIKSKNLTALVIWVLTPMVFLLFYHGNNGYVWDYYFTGVFASFLLVVAVIWTKYKIFLCLLLVVFMSQNLPRIKDYFSEQVFISLGTSLAAVDWVYQDANDQPFNADTYVPPVIPYAYDYLFLWRGQTKYRSQPSVSAMPLLYTLFEVDPPHPERLQAWMDRQQRIGIVLKQEVFGGVTSQRRQRI